MKSILAAARRRLAILTYAASRATREASYVAASLASRVPAVAAVSNTLAVAASRLTRLASAVDSEAYANASLTPPHGASRRLTPPGRVRVTVRRLTARVRRLTYGVLPLGVLRRLTAYRSVSPASLRAISDVLYRRADIWRIAERLADSLTARLTRQIHNYAAIGYVATKYGSRLTEMYIRRERTAPRNPDSAASEEYAVWLASPITGDQQLLTSLPAASGEELSAKLADYLHLVGYVLAVPDSLTLPAQSRLVGTERLTGSLVFVTRRHLGYAVAVVGGEGERWADTLRLYASRADAEFFAREERRALSPEAEITIREASEPVMWCECECDECKELLLESDTQFVAHPILGEPRLMGEYCANAAYQFDGEEIEESTLIQVIANSPTRATIRTEIYCEGEYISGEAIREATGELTLTGKLAELVGEDHLAKFLASPCEGIHAIDVAGEIVSLTLAD